jgi:SPP1 family predicted phage head-tail adaptor
MYRKAAPNLSSILNRKIEIYQPVQQGDENELGQRDIAKKLIDTVYAAIVPQTGTMLHGRAADTVLTRVTHKFIIRYRSDLTTDMYIRYGGQRYDIIYLLDPYANHERLEIFTEGIIQ